MFSIIIPLYNKENQILSTIKSVQNQTFQEFEIVIVNDGSTDNSVDKVKEIKDRRIKLINQENGGVSSARNSGIKNASYEYVAFLDADDEWKEDYLETILSMITEYSECSVFATNYKIVDSENEVRYIVDTNFAELEGTNSSFGVLKNYFNFANMTGPPLWTSAIVARKSSLLEDNQFPLNVTLGEDLIVWAKLACKYNICYTKKVCSIYNFRSAQELLKPRRAPDKKDVVGEEFIKLSKKYPSKDIQEYTAKWHKMRLMTFLKLNMRKDAFIEFYKILSYTKINITNIQLLILLILPETLRNKLLLRRTRNQSK